MRAYVYVMASQSGVLYVGVTNDLQRRILEHRQGLFSGFTKKYCCYKLVYFEQGTEIVTAIEREKEIKGWRRAKKVKIITISNPQWRDLYSELFG